MEQTMTTKPTDVVEAPASNYVLPGPKRTTPDVIVVQPSSAARFEHGGRVARSLGDRFLMLAECQQEFLNELRSRLEAIDEAMAEDSRARLKGSLREAIGVLAWCDAVQADLVQDGQRAAGGFEPIDLEELSAAVAAEGTGNDGSVLVTGHAGNPWWGDSKVLAETIRAGLDLVSERTGGMGLRHIELGTTDLSPWIRIAGAGEPGDGVEVRSLERFRRCVTLLGARVTPDALGPGGAGLVLHLPATSA
jgi:hypothetical protein